MSLINWAQRLLLLRKSHAWNCKVKTTTNISPLTFLG